MARNDIDQYGEHLAKGSYSPLDHDREEIRVLRILPTETTEELLRAETRTVSLLEEPYYECISYCWGDPAETEAVTLNGTNVSVTANLAAALRWFRAEGSEETWLWADAISINQNDMNERNRQVQLMSKIYSDAVEVRAWISWSHLGRSSAGSLPTNELMLAEAVQCRTALDYFVPEYDDLDLPGVDGLSIEDLSCMRDLFLNSFWRRAWIVQELVLASAIVIYYGALKYQLAGKTKFTRLAENVADYQVVGLKSSMQDEISKTLELYGQAEYLAASDHLTHSSSTWIHGTVQAGRKHDYIYAMLGLVPREVRITPDYNKSFEEVFAENTFMMMRATKDLVCLLGAMTGLSGMPSWAVDYSKKRVGGSYDGYFYRFSAGKPLAYSLDRCPTGAIIVNGVQFDTVASVSASFHDWDHTRPLDDVARMQHIRSQLRMAIAFHRVHSATTSRAADMSQELLRVLALDDITCLSAKGWGRLSWEQLADCRRRVNFGMRARASKEHQDTLARLLPHIAGKKLFVTAEGRFGIAEKEVQIDDLLCALGGCSMPLCARPKVKDGSTVYKLISPCYLEGVMDGQVLDVRERQLERDGLNRNLAVERMVLI